MSQYASHDMPVAKRMGLERFSAETAFQQRYLDGLDEPWQFFGMSGNEFDRAKRTKVWPNVLERERPDYWLPESKRLIEVIGCGRSGFVRIRTSKPLSVAYWTLRLGADGYFAIWNSVNERGYLIELETIIEAICHKDTKIIETNDNPLYSIPFKTLGIHDAQ